MTIQEKENTLKGLAQDIEINRVRLENAEQSVQQYLDTAKNLNEKLTALSLEEVDG